jgi:hypothetical protein
MSRPFKPYTGKNTFGVVKQQQDAGEYILNKKAIHSFCPPNVCVPSRTVATQGNRLLLRDANRIYFSACRNPYSIANLNINLVTQLDLSDVPIIQQNNIPPTTPAYLDTTAVPYLAYTIDPSGNLFGNTICGTNNFQNYLQFNYIPTTNPGHINSL